MKFFDYIKTSYDYNPLLIDGDPRWYLLSTLFDSNFQNKPTEQKIPKRIHQVWVGGKSLPEQYKRWGETWQVLNPEYEYKLWTDADVDGLQLPNMHLYEAIRNPGPKSDILRFHVLNKYGGIYADTDFECLKSFDDLLGFDFVTGVGYPSKVELYPGLIISTPHNYIIKELVNQIDQLTIEQFYSMSVHDSTSSYFFTRVFFEMVKEYNKNILPLPPAYLYPFPNARGFESQDGRRFIKPESYAIHYWEVSWMKP